jgi:hypothetical protein
MVMQNQNPVRPEEWDVIKRALQHYEEDMNEKAELALSEENKDPQHELSYDKAEYFKNESVQAGKILKEWKEVEGS